MWIMNKFNFFDLIVESNDEGDEWDVDDPILEPNE